MKPRRVLRRIRELARTGRYVLTKHGYEEMKADGLSILDVENCLITGALVEWQRDRESSQWKFLVEGATLSGDRAAVVAKLGPNGELFIITVYIV